MIYPIESFTGSGDDGGSDSNGGGNSGSNNSSGGSYGGQGGGSVYNEPAASAGESEPADDYVDDYEYEE